MKKKFTPYGDRIVIKPVDAEELSQGGLIIPDAGKEKVLPGTVVAVGPGIPGPAGLIKTTTKVGDTVIFPKFGCHNFDYDGEEYLIIREAELFLNLTNKQ